MSAMNMLETMSSLDSPLSDIKSTKIKFIRLLMKLLYLSVTFDAISLCVLQMKTVNGTSIKVSNDIVAHTFLSRNLNTFELHISIMLVCVCVRVKSTI